jgi:hypothetical protein
VSVGAATCSDCGISLTTAEVEAGGKCTFCRGLVSVEDLVAAKTILATPARDDIPLPPLPSRRCPNCGAEVR